MQWTNFIFDATTRISIDELELQYILLKLNSNGFFTIFRTIECIEEDKIIGYMNLYFKRFASKIMSEMY